MAETKTGITKSGIKENCEWNGVGPCPRHQIHQTKAAQPSAFGGSDDFVESLQSKGFDVDSDVITTEGYENYVATREESRVGRWSKNELIREGLLTEVEVDEVRNTPPRLKDAEPVVSKASSAGQLYTIIEDIHTENENSVNVDNMKEKYDGIRRIENMDDARNAFLNEEANKIYNAAWLIESDPSRLAKYGEEIVDAANNVARLENNPTGTLPVNRTGDGYQLSPKYDTLLTLLKTHKNEIRKEALVQGSYNDEKPSFSLVNARVEKIVNDKEIAKLEKAARNPFNFKAKKELASAKSMDKLLTDNLNYFESTNNDKVRTVI